MIVQGSGTSTICSVLRSWDLITIRWGYRIVITIYRDGPEITIYRILSDHYL
jgi:hypothetical protein